MSKSKASLTKGKRAKRARTPQADRGEMEEAALDQVSGGGRLQSSLLKRNDETVSSIVQKMS